MSGTSDQFPDSVWQLRELFEMLVSWGDETLAEDDGARHRLVLAGYDLGAQRAEALGREIRAIDVEYGLAILCKWPIKPEADPALQPQIDQFREAAVSAASEGQRVQIDPGFLTWSLDDLYERLGREGPPLAAT